MDNQDLIQEIKKGIALFKNETWNDQDLAARMFQLISEAGFRVQLERYISRVLFMRKSQVKYWDGDKSILPKCKGQESGVDKHSITLLKRLGITNIEDFLKQYQQAEFF